MDASEYVPAKYCSKCEELKPLSEYYLRSDSEQHRAQCKSVVEKNRKITIRRIRSIAVKSTGGIFKTTRNVSMITDAIDTTLMMHTESQRIFEVDYIKQ